MKRKESKCLANTLIYFNHQVFVLNSRRILTFQILSSISSGPRVLVCFIYTCKNIHSALTLVEWILLFWWKSERDQYVIAMLFFIFIVVLTMLQKELFRISFHSFRETVTLPKIVFFYFILLPLFQRASSYLRANEYYFF